MLFNTMLAMGQASRPKEGKRQKVNQAGNKAAPMKQMPALLLRAALGSPASSATRRTSALRMSPSGNKTSAQALHHTLRTPRKHGLLLLQSLVAEELTYASI